MSHYVLVHGAWEGSWTWENTSSELERQGHAVTAIDLPGSHGNKQAIPQVTMASYVKTVAEAIERLDHKVVLAGHSLAGAVISRVAELMPEKIERLIYVAAFLLKNGDSVLEAMQRDPGGEFLPELTFSEDQSYAMASERTLRDIAFHDVEDKDIRRSLPLMAEKQATEPFMAKVVVSDGRFGSVPKTYIRTTIDKITSPALQDEMIANWEVESVHVLPSGHFPTLSMPERLAELML
ncbi:MAG: alpha/beta fold hydrolase [Rhodospirillales bacterium]|nr:alpha/beta fold hydrolase [Rhodospirillales bacterium]MDH3918724.1 alpha/beta fold hydrolase [Rhodospirillales bacterium]MDH3970316.1 alpha/beta fold hydrolase [Rhodospirillales bacterium]